MPEEQPVVAAFDLDGTLTTRDCVVPFLRYVAGTRALAAGESLATRVASACFRPDTVEILGRHHAVGHVIVVSASYAVYVRPLVARLVVAEAIGTELAVDEAGRCTGALDGGNCRGAAKVVRLHRMLGQRFGGRDNVTLWAYGDSRGDEAMLAVADQPIWVRR